MSACIGASADGARAYTATASQGLLYMVEALYNASGLGLPIVMTVANRAIGAPINIWNDHCDSMSQRDSGWIQLYAETNQEALDLHIQAFRIAEELSLPVMVCMDGFILTHASSRSTCQTRIRSTPSCPVRAAQMLDPADPMTIGAMVGPRRSSRCKYLMHAKQMQALDLIPAIATDFDERSGEIPAASLRGYRDEDAETIIVALGSVLGTIEDVVDELRDEGVEIGALGVKCSGPTRSRRSARRSGERSGSSWSRRRSRSAPAASSVRTSASRCRAAIAGLRRRRRARRAADHRESLRGLVGDVLEDRLEPGLLHFLDLDLGRVEREFERMPDGARPARTPRT